jgi:hypothetical protein
VASTLVALPHVKDFESFEVFNAAVNIATEDLSTDDEGNQGVHVLLHVHSASTSHLPCVAGF